MLEGIRGNGYKSDIAVDDMIITRGECDQWDHDKVFMIQVSTYVEDFMINKWCIKATFEIILYFL